MMRKQYHFKKISGEIHIWDVDDLIIQAKDLEVFPLLLSDIREFDTPYWYDLEGDTPTCRSISNHVKLILNCSLDHPIILAADGSVMDGMHRVCKAFIEGLPSIPAKRFPVTPKPKYKNLRPEELEY